MFGLPIPQARDAATDGQLALGGCRLPDSPPTWQCPALHRWRESDETTWEERLLTVFVAYGYRDLGT